MLQKVEPFPSGCMETPDSISFMSISTKHTSRVLPRKGMLPAGAAITTFLSAWLRLRT